MFHYDAFISYNHNPRDNKITRSLQQKLESYKLPKDVVTSSGKEKIERVFLDKGELEVAGDLNEIIQNALENSDYLIVICSPESKASIWVKREIEFFLKNHSIDRILTVITDGEPFDVLPEAILYEDIDDGSGNIVRKSREPLSCDYRMPVRKAEREELPRLIAAILGCRYDELVQRQKQYRMRRQMALLAAAAVLFTSATAYLIWSNHKIQTNYDRSLREESINLAAQSEDALARGDRLGAIRYALDALPSEDNDRPVESDAVFALSEALNLYHSSRDEKWTAVRQYPSEVSCYGALPFTTDDKEYLAAYFSDGSVRIWDAVSGEELMTDYTQALSESEERIEQLEVTGDGTLLMMSLKKIFALDVASGKEKYTVDLSIPSSKEDSVSNYSKFCFNDDQLWVVVWGSEDKRLLQIDLNTHKAVKDLSAGDYYPEKLALSPDGKYLAFVHEINDFGADRLELIDTESGDKATLDRPMITDIHFDGSDRLIICGLSGDRPSEYDYSTVTSSNYISFGHDYLYEFTEYKERSQFITCLEAPSLSELWNTEYSGSFCGKPWMRFYPASKDRSGRYKGAFACVTGSNVRICSSSDGKVIDDVEFPDPVMHCSFNEERVKAVLQNGNMGTYAAKDKTSFTYRNVFIDGIRKLVTDQDAPSNSIYILSEKSSSGEKSVLTQYTFKGSDSNWKDFKNDLEHASMSILQRAVSYKDCFYEIWDEKEELFDDTCIARIICRKAETGEVVYDETVPIPEDTGEYTSYSYAGFDESAGSLYFAGDTESPLIEYDLQTGKSSSISLSADSSVLGKDPDNEPYIQYLSGTTGYSAQDIYGGILYCAAKISSYYEDPDTGEWIDEEDLSVITIDPGAGSVSAIPVADFPAEDSVEYTGFAIDAEKELLFTADSSNVISSYSFDGDKKWSSEPLPSAPLTMALTDDGHMLVLFESEPGIFELQVLDTNGGKKEAVTYIGKMRDVFSEPGFSESAFIPLSQEDALLHWEDEDSALVLSRSDWSLRGKISSYMTFNGQTDLFILGISDLGSLTNLGSVPYRTLDELIAEGRAVIEE